MRLRSCGLDSRVRQCGPRSSAPWPARRLRCFLIFFFFFCPPSPLFAAVATLYGHVVRLRGVPDGFSCGRTRSGSIGTGFRRLERPVRPDALPRLDDTATRQAAATRFSFSSKWMVSEKE